MRSGRPRRWPRGVDGARRRRRPRHGRPRWPKGRRSPSVPLLLDARRAAADPDRDGDADQAAVPAQRRQEHQVRPRHLRAQDPLRAVPILFQLVLPGGGALAVRAAAGSGCASRTSRHRVRPRDTMAGRRRHPALAADRRSTTSVRQLLPGGGVERIKAMDLQVGHIIRVQTDQRVPADLVLLRTRASGIVFVRTDGLDGEMDPLRLAAARLAHPSPDPTLPQARRTGSCALRPRARSGSRRPRRSRARWRRCTPTRRAARSTTSWAS